MADEELERLIEDIRQNGQVNPIIVIDNNIVDGRNRFLACERLGITPKTEEWHLNEERIAQLVVSLNLHRRHLNESQIAMIASRLVNMKQGERTDLLNAGDNLASAEARLSQTQAAEMFNVSRSLVQRAAFVAKNGVDALVEMVEEGEIPLREAVEIAELPKTKQMRILKKGRDASRKRAIKLREKTALDTNCQTQAVCLSCNPQLEFTAYVVRNT
jgi:ParB-like chromosome segregation protein Spo0J